MTGPAGPPASQYAPGGPPAPQYGPPGQQFGPPGGPIAGVAPPYRFQMRRLTTVDKITAVAALVLLLSLWLPWFEFGSGSFSVSQNGINAHSYLAFVLLTAVVLVSYLAARAGWDRLPVRPPIAHAPLLLVLGVLQFIVVLIGVLSTPDGANHSAGSWIALVAALGGSLPIVIPAIQATQRR